MERTEYIRRSEEYTIDLISLFRYMAKRLSFGIIVIAIGLVLGVGFGIWKDSRPYHPVKEEELLQIKDMENRYLAYQQTVKERNDGYLTTLSENKDYYYGTVVYYISASNETDTTLLGNILNITATSDYLYDIRDILGIGQDVYISSLRSLMSAGFSMQRANSGVTVSLNEELSKEVGYGLLTYSFSYLDSEQIAQMMQYVDNQVAERASNQAGAYPFTLKKIRTSVLPYTSNVVLSAQSSINASNLNDLLNFENYLDELAETESEAVNYENMVKQFRATYLNENKCSAVKKYALLGAFGCLVLWGLAMACQYMLSGNVYREKELMQDYGLNVLGVLPGTQEKKTRLLRFGRSSGLKDYCSVSYLNDSVSFFEKSRMALASVGQSAGMDFQIKELTQESDGGILAGNLLADADVLKCACENSGLILMVALGKTKSSDLTAVLDICNAHTLRVYGVIAVDEN